MSFKKIGLTREQTGWLVAGYNAALLLPTLILVPFIGMLKTWDIIVDWLTYPAAISFPSAIEPYGGFFIWEGVFALVNHPDFAQWDTLGAAAIVLTGLLGIPISYFTGTMIFDLAQRHGRFPVLVGYVSFSLASFFAVQWLATTFA